MMGLNFLLMNDICTFNKYNKEIRFVEYDGLEDYCLKQKLAKEFENNPNIQIRSPKRTCDSVMLNIKEYDKPKIDHSALIGLEDDDHTQYIINKKK